MNDDEDDLAPYFMAPTMLVRRCCGSDDCPRNIRLKELEDENNG